MTKLQESKGTFTLVIPKEIVKALELKKGDEYYAEMDRARKDLIFRRV